MKRYRTTSGVATSSAVLQWLKEGGLYKVVAGVACAVDERLVPLHNCPQRRIRKCRITLLWVFDGSRSFGPSTIGGFLKNQQNAKLRTGPGPFSRMSRFKSTPKSPPASTLPAPVAAIALANRIAPRPSKQPTGGTAKALVTPEADSNIVASFGFFLYCAYSLSGFANDWAMRLLGNRVYISTVTLLLLPVPWLLSGNMFRGLRRPVGRWWAGFLVLVLLAAPFSVWKGGSATLIWNYIPRSYLTFFYICA